jgi:Family of unknown function (DUF6286)
VSGVRILLRVLAVLLAVALLGAGLLVAVNVLLAGLRKRSFYLPYETLARDLRRTTWASGQVRAAAIGACLVGLLLLWLALRSARSAALPLAPGPAGVDTEVSRRGLQAALAAAATRVDGVQRARVRVRRLRARVVATSHLRDVTGLRERIEEQVRSALAEIGLRHQPTVAVKVRGSS